MANLAEAAFESSLFEDIKPFKAPDTRRIVGVRLRHDNRLLDCDAQGERYKVGDYVIVRLKHGERLAEVLRPSRSYLHHGEHLPGVVRKASERDLENAANMARWEEEVLKGGIAIVQQRNCSFKLIGVERSGDGSRATVYFCSEDKVDFRDFVQELSARFHTRVEMRQVGIRDQAGIAGGIGSCGRELCCSSWLKGFAPISIKMAKNQGLALDNEKLTGQCGRLKCCLAYEDDTYKLAAKTLPKRGFKFEVDGQRYVVVSTNVLLQKVLVQDPEHGHHLLEIPVFNAMIKKPEVKTLSKVNFMDAEAERLAEEMAPEVSLVGPGHVETVSPAVAARAVAAEAAQAAIDVGAALRAAAPDQETGDEDEEEGNDEETPPSGQQQGGGDRQRQDSSRRRRGRRRRPRGGGQRNG